MRRPLLAAALAGALLSLAPAAAAVPRLYSPNYGSEAVGAFDLGDGTAPTPVLGSPFPATSSPALGGLIAMAFAPDGARGVSGYLFDGGAQGLAVAGDGSLAPVGLGLETPSVVSVAVSPDGRFAYTTTRDFLGEAAVGIVGYSLGGDGALSGLAGSPFGAGVHYDVAITPDSRFLFATTGLGVARYAIGSDGSLAAVGPPVAVPGAYRLTVDPESRYLYVGLDNGSGSGVQPLTIGADGSLVPVGVPALTGDVAPSFPSVSPDGGHVYMPDTNVDGIVTARVGPDGALAVIGTTPVEDPESLAPTPDGRYMYIDTGGAIEVAAIGADGVPSLLGSSTPWDSGSTPPRMVLQPQPAPVAAVSATPAAAGAATRFDAAGSQRAARYDWDFGDGAAAANAGPAPEHVYPAAGEYTARVTVTDANGCSARQIYTGQSTVCPGGAAATATVAVRVAGPPPPRPRIRSLRLSPKRFAAAPRRKGAKRKAKRGSRVVYGVSANARVRFLVERRLVGRSVAGKCRPVNRRNQGRRPCVRFKRVGSFARSAGAGRNAFRFRGRIGKRRLPAGRYRLTATARNAGGTSAPRRAAFRIVRG